MKDPSRIAGRLRTLDELKSLIDSLPGAMREQAIADIKFVLAEKRQQLVEEFRLQLTPAQVPRSDSAR